MEPNYQCLGKKTLLLFILEKSKIFFLFLLIAVIFLLLSIFAGKPLYSFYNQNISSLLKSNYSINFTYIFRLISLGSFIASLIALGIEILISWLLYINYRFALDENALKIKRGVINKEEVSIPYQRIQNIDIDRSIPYRVLRLGRLIILTAGEEEQNEPKAESEGILPALDYRFALKLQEELLRRSSIEKVVMEKGNNTISK
jgi:uncharacterized membrane protein YdbT with pleckstrin-like domain